MTALPSPFAADSRSGEGDNTAPRSGCERPRTAARFHERRERDHGRAICTGLFVSTRASGRASLKTETRARNPKARMPVPHSYRVVVGYSGAIAGGLRGFLLPVFRRRFNFSGRLARWSFPLRFNSSQEPKRRAAQGLKTFSSALSHVRNLAWGSKHEVHRKSASGAQSSE